MSSGTSLIRCNRFIDGSGQLREDPVDICIGDGEIKGVFPRGEAPERYPDQVVDAGSGTVMPGLMDVHLHLASVNDPSEPHAYMGMLTADPCLQTLHAARNARVVLEAGFTTVRDVAGFANGRNKEIVALKRAIEIGLVPGPRIIVTGWITPTAGHLDMGTPVTWGWDRSTVADGPWECRKVVRSLVRDGVDAIKTSASGGSGGFREEIWWRNYTLEELGPSATRRIRFDGELRVTVTLSKV